MNDRLKEIVEQTGGSMGNVYACYGKDIERFAELVRADALEEAAIICDQLNYNDIGALGCAAALRNRADENLYEQS